MTARKSKKSAAMLQNLFSKDTASYSASCYVDFSANSSVGVMAGSGSTTKEEDLVEVVSVKIES